MTGRDGWAGVAHDVALAWMTGGIAGAGMAAVLLFRLAPTREMAGQIGNVIFNVLGESVLALALVVLATRLILRKTAAGGGGGRGPALWPAVASCALAAMLALWISPVMTGIWHNAPHDPAGGGLTGGDKARFMRLHGAGNLIYLTLLGLGSLMIAARAIGRTERPARRGARENSGGAGVPGEPPRP